MFAVNSRSSGELIVWLITSVISRTFGMYRMSALLTLSSKSILFFVIMEFTTRAIATHAAAISAALMVAIRCDVLW